MGLEPLVLDGNGDARKVPAHFLEGYGNLDTSLGGGNLGKVAAVAVLDIERACERFIEAGRRWAKTSP